MIPESGLSSRLSSNKLRSISRKKVVFLGLKCSVCKLWRKIMSVGVQVLDTRNCWNRCKCLKGAACCFTLWYAICTSFLFQFYTITRERKMSTLKIVRQQGAWKVTLARMLHSIDSLEERELLSNFLWKIWSSVISGHVYVNKGPFKLFCTAFDFWNYAHESICVELRTSIAQKLCPHILQMCRWKMWARKKIGKKHSKVRTLIGLIFAN